LHLLQFDFRVGGAYRFAYDVPGGATLLVNGVYRTIEPPSTIVFSWNIASDRVSTTGERR
jgi:uncharacterized protein YndB with AHSA1/START domain